MSVLLQRNRTPCPIFMPVKSALDTISKTRFSLDSVLGSPHSTTLVPKSPIIMTPIASQILMSRFSSKWSMLARGSAIVRHQLTHEIIFRSVLHDTPLMHPKPLLYLACIYCSQIVVYIFISHTRECDWWICLYASTCIKVSWCWNMIKPCLGAASAFIRK